MPANKPSSHHQPGQLILNHHRRHINQYLAHHKHQSIAGPRALATGPTIGPPLRRDKSSTHLRSKCIDRATSTRIPFTHPLAAGGITCYTYSLVFSKAAEPSLSHLSTTVRHLPIHYLKLTRIIRHNLRAPHLCGLVSHFANPFHTSADVLCIEIYMGAARYRYRTIANTSWSKQRVHHSVQIAKKEQLPNRLPCVQASRFQELSTDRHSQKSDIPQFYFKKYLQGDISYSRWVQNR